MPILTCPTTTIGAISSSFSSHFQKPSKTLHSFPKSSLQFSSRIQPSPTIFKSLTPLNPSSDFSSIDASSISPSTANSTSSRSLKSRLRNGETLYGIFLLSFSPTIAEIVGLAGYDFAVVDMEHGPGGITEALQCLHALAATRTPAILRLPESCPTWAKKALDLGPQGIMFPMIDSPKLAKKAVSYCRFPPTVRAQYHQKSKGGLPCPIRGDQRRSRRRTREMSEEREEEKRWKMLAARRLHQLKPKTTAPSSPVVKPNDRERERLGQGE